MKKINSLLLLMLSLICFSCSKDSDSQPVVPNQELIIGNWQLLEIVNVNTTGNINTQDLTKTVLHQLAFNSNGKLIITIQPLNEDHMPSGEVQTIESNYGLSEDGKHIIISNTNSVRYDILRLGKTDLIYKINSTFTGSSEYRLRRM